MYVCMCMYVCTHDGMQIFQRRTLPLSIYNQILPFELITSTELVYRLSIAYDSKGEDPISEIYTRVEMDYAIPSSNAYI